MFFGLNRRTHLFGEKGTKSCTVRVINEDFRTPLGNMVWRVLCHAMNTSIEMCDTSGDDKGRIAYTILKRMLTDEQCVASARRIGA